MKALDLLHTLAHRGAIPATRVKDFRTSLQKLADATHVPLEDLDLAALAPTYETTLKTYFAELSPPASVHTQRNTIANLRQLYRALAIQHLLPGAVAPKSKRVAPKVILAEGKAASPYRHRTSAVLVPYAIPEADWPASMRDGWARYRTSRTFEIRPVTLALYQRNLSYYIGFALRIDRPPAATWDDLFDSTRLVRFVSWHAARIGAPRISQMGFMVVRLVVLIAQHDQRPEHESLLTLANKLPPVLPLHNKQAPIHTISARELEDVGLTLLREAREPLKPHTAYLNGRPERANKYPRLGRAITHQASLMLRLLWRLPLRSRAIREMELGKNLYRDDRGAWHLRYVGDELKVSHRRGVINRLELPWPPDLVDHLEEYLQEFRPCFPNAATSRLMFLTRDGTPLTHNLVWHRISEAVYLHLRKRLYPHLLRTLWVDQYLLASNGDISTAAYMLNDSVNTVLKRYHELRGADHVQKAYAFNQAVLKPGR